MQLFLQDRRPRYASPEEHAVRSVFKEKTIQWAFYFLNDVIFRLQIFNHLKGITPILATFELPFHCFTLGAWIIQLRYRHLTSGMSGNIIL